MLDVGGLSSSHGELDSISLVQALAGAFDERSVTAIVSKSHCLKVSK